MATFETGGRGRRLCSNCERYISSRAEVCDCGYNFVTRTTESKFKAKEVEDDFLAPPSKAIPKAVAPVAVAPVKQPVVFTEGGRGRKQCPCKVYVGALTKICPSCGNDFSVNPSIRAEKAATEVKPVNTFDGPGYGRKQCTSCKKYVAARSLACGNCGAAFKKDVPDPVPVVRPVVLQPVAVQPIKAPPPKPVNFVPAFIMRKPAPPKVRVKPEFKPLPEPHPPLPELPKGAGDWLFNQDRDVQLGADGEYRSFKVVVGPPCPTPTWDALQLHQQGFIGLYVKQA